MAAAISRRRTTPGTAPPSRELSRVALAPAPVRGPARGLALAPAPEAARGRAAVAVAPAAAIRTRTTIRRSTRRRVGHREEHPRHPALGRRRALATVTRPVPAAAVPAVAVPAVAVPAVAVPAGVVPAAVAPRRADASRGCDTLSNA